MTSSKLLGRVSAVGLQYVGFLWCAILVVFGPCMSSVNAGPYKLDFFKPCDPAGWRKNFHGDHPDEQEPPPGGNPLPPGIHPVVPLIPPNAPQAPKDLIVTKGTGVSLISSGLGVPPTGVGEVHNDTKSEKIGTYTIISVKCKAKGANRKVGFYPGHHTVSHFYYLKLQDMRGKIGNMVGVLGQPGSTTPLPPDLLNNEEFQGKLRGVLDGHTAGMAGRADTAAVETTTTRGKPRRNKRNHENGGKWDWRYLGPASQIPPVQFTIYQEMGVMYGQGVTDCNVTAKPDEGVETEYKARIHSAVAVDITPSYANCVSEFGFIPIYNAKSKSYSFESGGGSEKDLAVTIPSGLVWEGGPKMWVAQRLEDEKDTWFNDWGPGGELQLVVDRIKKAWSAKFLTLDLNLAPNSNRWEKIKVPIPEGHSIRLYQGAAKCGPYGVLGFSTGVRLFKGGACTALPPQLLAVDTLGLGNCTTCEHLDSCKGPDADECKGQCGEVLKRFDAKFFLH